MDGDAFLHQRSLEIYSPYFSCKIWKKPSVLSVDSTCQFISSMLVSVTNKTMCFLADRIALSYYLRQIALSLSAYDRLPNSKVADSHLVQYFLFGLQTNASTLIVAGAAVASWVGLA